MYFIMVRIDRRISEIKFSHNILKNFVYFLLLAINNLDADAGTKFLAAPPVFGLFLM